MKKADSPYVVIIKGDNNKVSLGGGKNFLPLAVAIIIVGAVLTVSLCSPDLLVPIIRWIIGAAVNS